MTIERDIAQELDDDLDVEIELVVLDLAGTTVRDDGLVERAFALAAERTGLVDDDEQLAGALGYVRETMGQSKIDVFRALAADDAAAERANEAFETAYLEFAVEGGIEAIPGADALLRQLRDFDVKIALVTGFSRATMNAILDVLGWVALVDVTLTPAEAGRGRPFPDLPLTALMRVGASGTAGMVIVGDTASDMLSGVNAGAGLIVGVLTGAHDRETLEAAGADVVLDDISELAPLLGIDEASIDEAIE